MAAVPKPAFSLSIAVPQHRALRIDVPHLVEYLDDSSAVVVDVRDQDFKGGHIPGSIHVPYEQFETHIDDVLKRFSDASKKYILLCMYSRERGPACAEMLLAKFPSGATPPDVHVLTGGFNAWINHHSKISVDATNKHSWSLGDAKRVADFDPTLWTAVTENRVTRVVYKRDADDHSYSIKTPNAGQAGPFAPAPSSSKK